MIPRYLLPALLTALLAVLALAGQVAAGATGTLNGTVVDGTKGAKLASGLSVTLTGVGQGHQFVADQTAKVDASGHFSFDNLLIDPNITYVVSTDYAGVNYTATVAKPTDAGLPPVELKVYEPTTSDAALKIDSANWLLGAIDPRQEQAQVLAMFTIVNTGDHTYVGDHRGDPGSATPGILPRTLRLPLPDGASDFQPMAGLNPSTLLPVENGYVDTAPVTPGDHQIVYTFKMGYSAGVAELHTALPYPATKVHFLAPDAGLEFRSDRLGDGGTTQLAGNNYRVLGADNLKANDVITVDVVGLPELPTNRLSPKVMQIGGFVVIGLAVLLALFFALRPQNTGGTDPLAERRGLLAAIAQLDERYAAGQLNASRYRVERSQKKRQLIDVMLGGRATLERSGGS
ncbi:MAG TPA: hypothetical protein VKX96_14610 [Chloroflexota bacterium]|nr:hypothetical protein [Chloroflexota bacterium]